jgi:hypothetical protein
MNPPITITAKQRDLLYHRLLVNLSGIDAVYLAVNDKNFETADRLRREFFDDLNLLMDDLGWSEVGDDQPVELTSPPEIVRSVFERLRVATILEDEDERRDRELLREAEEEKREVRAACDEVLSALDGLLAADGAKHA